MIDLTLLRLKAALAFDLELRRGTLDFDLGQLSILGRRRRGCPNLIKAEASLRRSGTPGPGRREWSGSRTRRERDYCHRPRFRICSPGRASKRIGPYHKATGRVCAQENPIHRTPWSGVGPSPFPFSLFCFRSLFILFFFLFLFIFMFPFLFIFIFCFYSFLKFGKN
jgi:hypothetical protein